MKKFYLFITLLLLATGMNINALEFTSGGLNYKVIDESSKTCEVSGYEELTGDIVIPSQVEGYTVVRIGYMAFDSNKNIQRVNLPETMIAIDSYAFSECSNLKTVSGGKQSITTIGGNAFWDVL